MAHLSDMHDLAETSSSLTSAHINPFNGIADRVLVKFETETDKRPLCGIIRTGKVFILKAEQIIAEAQPGILSDVIPDRKSAAVASA